MKDLLSYYPVICTEFGEALVEEFQQCFNFSLVYESDWYWHLSQLEKPWVQLAFVQSNHDSVPEAYRKPVQGMILNIEVEDVSGYYHQEWQSKAKERVVLPLKEEPWGQKHFIVNTADKGLLVDIIQVIPASAEYQEHYIAT